MSIDKSDSRPRTRNQTTASVPPSSPRAYPAVLKSTTKDYRTGQPETYRTRLVAVTKLGIAVYYDEFEGDALWVVRESPYLDTEKQNEIRPANEKEVSPLAFGTASFYCVRRESLGVNRYIPSQLLDWLGSNLKCRDWWVAPQLIARAREERRSGSHIPTRLLNRICDHAPDGDESSWFKLPDGHGNCLFWDDSDVEQPWLSQ